MTRARPVVVRPAESPLQQWRDFRGRVDFRTLIGGGSTPTDTLTGGTFWLQPGASLNRHSHAAAEIYTVIRGTAQLLLDGGTRPIAPGDMVFLPRHVVHGVENDGQEDVEIVFVYAADSSTDPRVEYTMA